MGKKKRDTQQIAPEEVASTSIRRRRLIRLLVFLALTVAALSLVYYLSDIFAPLLAALVVAYMLDPLVDRLQKRGWSRGRAVLLIFAVTILLMASILGGMVPFLARDIGGSAAALSGEFNDANWNSTLDEDEKASFVDRDGDGKADPGYIVKLDLWMKKSPRLKEISVWARQNKLPERIVRWAQENAREIAQHTFDFGSAGLKAVGNFVWSIAWWSMMALLFPIYLYVFLKGLDGIWGKTTSVIPSVWRPKFERIALELGTSLSAFFRGRFVVVLAIAFFTAASFGILGLKFGVVLGIAIGLASIVPFLNIAFLIPALLVAALEFQSLGGVLLVLLLYALGQLLDPILSPYLLSRSTGLHPVTVLLSLLVWGRLLGAVGLLLAVPLTAAVKIAGREIVMPLLAEADAPETEGDTA